MIIPRSCTRNRKFKPPGLSAGRWVSPAEGSGFGFCFPASWTAFGVRRAASLPPLPGRPTGALAQDQGGYGGEARLSGCFRSWAPLGLTGPGGPVYAALAGRGVIRPANLLGGAESGWGPVSQAVAEWGGLSVCWLSRASCSRHPGGQTAE